MTRPSKASIPSFPELSLNTNHIRWMHQSTWEDLGIQFFAEARGKILVFSYKDAPFRSSSSQEILQTVSRWILFHDKMGSSPCGWAELQVLPGRFYLGILLYDYTPPCPPEVRNETLSLLITASFLVGGLDRIRLFPNSHEDYRTFNAWGEPIRYATLQIGWLYQRDSHSSLVQKTLIEISPSHWWMTSLGDSSRKQLQYLTVRQTRRQHFQQFKKPKASSKRRGFWSRFFRLSR